MVGSHLPLPEPLSHFFHLCCSSAPKSARERTVWTQPWTGRVAVSTQHCLAFALSHQAFYLFFFSLWEWHEWSSFHPLSVICYSFPEPETNDYILCLWRWDLRRIFWNRMISKCLCLVSECKYLGLTPSLYWLKASPMDSSSITLSFLSQGT